MKKYFYSFMVAINLTMMLFSSHAIYVEGDHPLVWMQYVAFFAFSWSALVSQKQLTNTL